MVKELENDAASNAVPDYAPDDTDRRIIALLQEDGRMSTQDIARTQGAASSTIRKRIRRLEGTGTMRVVAVVDFAAAGYGELLAIGVEVESRNAEAVGQAPGHNANHVGATTWCAAGITWARQPGVLRESRVPREPRVLREPGLPAVTGCAWSAPGRFNTGKP